MGTMPRVHNDPKVYSVWVQAAAATESADCLVFARNLGTDHRAVEFVLVGSSFDDSGLSITSNRPPTFREQFRLLGDIHDAVRGSEAVDERFIKQRMQEAFGSGITVEVTTIRPASRLGR